MQFKKIENTDVAEQLTPLLHRAYAADVKLGIHFAASSVTVEDVRKHIESTPTFVLEDDDGTIIATTSVRLPWSDNPGPFGLPHLGWVATNPDYQQQGFSKEIINWVVTNYVQPALHTPAVTIGTAADRSCSQYCSHCSPRCKITSCVGVKNEIRKGLNSWVY